MPRGPSPLPANAAPSASALLARAVAERWAEAVKAQSIYPAGHARVGTALDAWAQALAEAREVSADGTVQIVFADGGVLAAGTRFDVDPDGGLAWLRERLDHAALAGVQFLPSASREEVAAFGRRLLDVTASKDRSQDPGADFVGLGAGLHLLDRRFEGVFSGTDGASNAPQRTWGGLGPPLDARGRVRLAETLRDDPTIRKRLATIRTQLGGQSAAGDDGAWELLHRLTGVLPAAATEDVTRVRIVAGGLLDALEARIQTGDPLEGLTAFFDDPALERRVAFLCTSLFRRDGPKAAVQETEAKDARRAQGHRQDDAVTDDLAAFLYELYHLPQWTGSDAQADSIESRPETLGVLLHLLVHQERETPYPGFDWALRSSLADAGPQEARVLRRVLDSITQRADDVAASAAVDRTLAALARVGQLALARRCGFLSAERIVGVFPREFVTWVDALDLTSGADRAELAHVLAQVGPERIAAAAPALMRLDGLLEPSRLDRFLSLPDGTLAPMVEVLHRQGGPAYRSQVIGWLRQLPANGSETAPLHLMDDPIELPVEYVELVLGRLLGRAPAKPPDDLVVGLLARFVAATAGRADRRARRIQALRHLASYDRPEALALLRSLAYGRRWLVLPSEEKPVRDAARKALEQRGAA
jgi:hypothetical protein